MNRWQAGGLCAYFLFLASIVVYFETRPRKQVPQEPSFEDRWNAMDDDLDDVPEGEHVMRAARGLPSPAIYPAVPMSKIAPRDGWKRPRALLRGTVILAKREKDNDFHFVIEDGNDKVVCEEIPELPMPNGHPKIGDKIIIWGIVRYDSQHGGWAELHPCVNWRPQ